MSFSDLSLTQESLVSVVVVVDLFGSDEIGFRIIN